MARILVVDDSPVDIKIIRKLLGDLYEVLEALDGKTAIRLAIEEKPDLVLLDILMPEMDGFAVCKELKKEPETADIPVIFITAVTGAQRVVMGFEAGGQDYITKPFYSPELCARIKVHLDLKRSREMLKTYAEELVVKNQQLSQLMNKLQNTAMTDFITGLENRRSMTHKMKVELAKLKKSDRHLVLMMLDIDNFKKINDTYGHECGDTVLQVIALIMNAVVGNKGIIARWGGEEFLIMLFNTDVESGQVIAEEIRQSIEISPFCYQNTLLSLTVTLGLTALNNEISLDACIRKADEALYQGKKGSKNCVVVIK